VNVVNFIHKLGTEILDDASQILPLKSGQFKMTEVTPQNVEKPVAAKTTPLGRDKATVPGWTRMRAFGKNKTTPSETEMDSRTDLKSTYTHASGNEVGEVDALHEVRSDDELLEPGQEQDSQDRNREVDGDAPRGGAGDVAPGGVYKVYKRRWFGLIQLVLLNIIGTFEMRCAWKHHSFIADANFNL
jgi:hypothetical protein